MEHWAENLLVLEKRVFAVVYYECVVTCIFCIKQNKCRLSGRIQCSVSLSNRITGITRELHVKGILKLPVIDSLIRSRRNGRSKSNKVFYFISVNIKRPKMCNTEQELFRRMWGLHVEVWIWIFWRKKIISTSSICFVFSLKRKVNQNKEKLKQNINENGASCYEKYFYIWH